jgi:hypothetical protein
MVDLIEVRVRAVCLVVFCLAVLNSSCATQGDSAILPCLVDGKQSGTYTRTKNQDGTLSYDFSPDCQVTADGERKPAR